MNKKMLSLNMLASVCSYIVSLAVSLLLTPYIIGSLGKELYSYFSIANNFVSYMSIVSIALNSMASRFITIEEARGSHKEANRYFSSVFWGNIVMIAVLSLLSFVLIFRIEWILNISEENIGVVKLLFVLIFAAMFVKLISSVFSVATYVKDRLYLNSVESIFHAVIRAAMLFGLYIILEPSILYLGYVSLGLAAVDLCYFVVINRKIYPESGISFSDCSIAYMRRLISSGVWRSVDSLGGLLLFNTDLMIANILINESAGGTLSIVHTFPTMLQGILSAITSVFLPGETWLYGKKEYETLISRVKFSQKICGAVVSVPVCGLLMLGRHFFELWVPGNDSGLLQLLSVLCIGYMPMFIVSWPVANLNVIMNRNKVPAILNVIGGLVNLSSMVMLIKYGGAGIYVIPLTSLLIQIFFNAFFIPIYPCIGLGISKWTFYPPIIKCTVECLMISVPGYFILSCFDIVGWGSFFGIALSVAVFISGINIFIWFSHNDRIRILQLINARIRRQSQRRL